MAILDLADFRGGYHVDTPSALMSSNDLLLAENCYWRNGLYKRYGIRKYSATSFTGTLQGGMRVYIAGAWHTILAEDNGATCSFYYGTATTFTKITGLTFSTGYSVEMDELNGNIVAVNGNDKPALITYASSTWSIATLESNDVRDRGNADWWAGQYVATASTKYIDDTTDAQSETTADFSFCTTVDGSGFWAASDFTFNKVKLVNAQQTATTTVAYDYWNGTAWATLSMVSTPTWTDATGDKTIEFNWPTAWARTASTVEASANITNRWTIRVLFTSAPAAGKSCDYLTLSHTQYLTQVLGGDKPDIVLAHASRMWLFSGNNFYYSVANTVTGWDLLYADYVMEGGPKIRAAISFKEVLCIMKDNAMHGFSGDSFDNFLKRKLSDQGAASKRSVAVVGDYLVRVWNNDVWMWDGTSDVRVSKHIHSDVSSWTTSDAAAAQYRGEYWVAFPTDGIALNFDPDTMRSDDVGDRRVSFFKQRNHAVARLFNCNGQGDTGYFLGIVNATAPYLARLDSGNYDKTTASATITMKWKTREDPFTSIGEVKGYRRVKYHLADTSSTSSYTMKWITEAQTVSATVGATVGSSTFYTELSFPYLIDGKRVAFYGEHAGLQRAGLLSISVDWFKRRF